MIINFSKYQEFFFEEEYNILKKVIQEYILSMNYFVKSIDIQLVDDRILKKVNQEFLRHNYSTDIITFNHSSKNREIEAELLVGNTMLKFNSIKYKVSLKEELLRLIFHGILHLVGFKDKNKSEIELMKKNEDILIEKFLFHVKHKS